MMRLSLALVAALSLAATPAIAGDGKNRKVTVRNLSSQTIYSLYASPISSKSWEEDMLGSNTISSGASQVANIDNGTTECRYDLKAKLADGREFTRRGVNVCAASTWVIGDSGESLQ
jgi:hypothetical protein